MVAVNGPTLGARGGSIIIYHTVNNQGSEAASYFRVGFYLSVDSTITISSSMAYGTYYLGAIADHNDWVDEDDESNNSLEGNLNDCCGSKILRVC